MALKIMKCITMAALLGGLVFARSFNYHAYLLFIVCAGALIVSVQAGRLRHYLWLAALFTIAYIFNPFLPLEFDHSAWMVMNFAALAMFTASFFTLKTKPRLSIASITDRVPRSESL